LNSYVQTEETSNPAVFELRQDGFDQQRYRVCGEAPLYVPGIFRLQSQIAIAKEEMNLAAKEQSQIKIGIATLAVGRKPSGSLTPDALRCCAKD